MKKIKRILALVMAAAMAFCLVGCGEIPYEEITGEWTTKTLDGTPVEEYAKNLNVTKAEVASNITIERDGKMTIANSSASRNYTYERKSNGIEVMEEGKDEVVFSMGYDSSAKTFSYMVDFQNGQSMGIVMERGKTDFSQAAASDGKTDSGQKTEKKKKN